LSPLEEKKALLRGQIAARVVSTFSLPRSGVNRTAHPLQSCRLGGQERGP